MILNTFVIPVLTIASGGQTLYDLFASNDWNFAKLLGELFIPHSGEFFIILLIQQGVISVIFYALNLSDIIQFYTLPDIAVEKRKIFNDSQPW